MAKQRLNREEAKLTFFGYLATNPDLAPRDFIQELGVPAQTLSSWKAEFKRQTEDKKIDDLVNAEEVVIERVAREVAYEMSAVVPEPLELDEMTGEVMPASKLRELQEKREKEAEEREAKLVTGFKESIHGFQALKQQSQVVASSLLNKIAESIDSGELTVKEQTQMAAALSSLHSAYFNKPVTNVQVNTQNNVNANLDSFRENLKP